MGDVLIEKVQLNGTRIPCYVRFSMSDFFLELFLTILSGYLFRIDKVGAVNTGGVCIDPDSNLLKFNLKKEIIFQRNSEKI